MRFKRLNGHAGYLLDAAESIGQLIPNKFIRNTSALAG
jgi:hypothetical protein